MARQEYDTFVLQDPAEMPDEQRLELIVRHLTPKDRRYKYNSCFAQAKISKDKDALPDLLWIRLGRGQLQPEPWSIEILEVVDKFAN